MNFEIDNFLDHVDEWKFKLHEKLKKMTPRQRDAFWHEAAAEARALGLTVLEPGESPGRKPKKRPRQTG